MAVIYLLTLSVPSHINHFLSAKGRHLAFILLRALFCVSYKALAVHNRSISKAPRGEEGKMCSWCARQMQIKLSKIVANE